MLSDQSIFPQYTNIPPGVEWNVEVFEGGEIRKSWGHESANESIGEKVIDTLDMNGDGLLDQVYIGAPDCPVCGGTSGSDYAVYLHPGPEGLLETVTNELGGVTRLTYKPSTWFRGPAQATTAGEGQPESLPAAVRTAPPQWLLASITVEDGRPTTDDQDQSIEYAELRYDTERREYLGARMAESVDPASVVTRRFYHQTPERQGRLEFLEVEDAAGAVLRTEKTTWTAVSTVSDSNGTVPDSWFAQPTEIRTTLRDPGSGNLQTRVESRSYAAKTGNLLTRRDWGPDGVQGTADDFEKQFHYTPNLSTWLVSYPYATAEFLGAPTGGAWGKIELLYYDGNGLLTPPEQGLVTERLTFRGDRNLIEQWSYDAFGNQRQYFDPRAVDAASTTPTRETVYDPEFQVFPVLIRNALLYLTEFEFDTDFGEVAKVRDPNGYLRCWGYDSFGRLTTLSDEPNTPSGLGGSCSTLLAEFDFPSVGDPGQQHILETRHPGGLASDVRSRRFFDGLGRVYQEEAEHDEGNFAITVRGWGTRGEEDCEAFPFHGAGDIPYECGALSGPRLETDHDALLRPTATRRVSPSGTPTLITRAYSIGNQDGKAGNELIETRTTRTEAGWDRIVHSGTDPSGRVVAIQEAAGGLTLLERDPKGRIVAVDGPDVALDPSGSGSHPNRLAIGYNPVDQRTALSGLWAAGGWSYQYDASGNLSQQTSPGGRTIRFHWDALNRLALKDYGAPNTIASPGIGEDILYLYDTATNGIGRLALVDTPEAAGVDTSFGYDLPGRVSSKVRNFGESGAFAFGYSYDGLGRRVFTSLPNGQGIVHVYDGSVLETIKVPGGEGPGGRPRPGLTVAKNVLLHASGALKDINYPIISGGSLYTYEPDTHRLDTAWSWRNASDTLQDLDLGYDLAGSLTTVTDALGELSQVFTYDPLHRLATATGSGGFLSYGSLAYSYDAAGNLLTKGPVGAPLTLLYGGGNAGPHGVTGVSGAETGSLSYDADGQVSYQTRGQQSLSFGWDDDGRLTQVNLALDYLYDESGQRSRKKNLGSTVDTLYVDREYEVDLVNVFLA